MIKNILTLLAFSFVFLLIVFGITEFFNLSFRVASQITIVTIFVGLMFALFWVMIRVQRTKAQAEKVLKNLSGGMSDEKVLIAQYRESILKIENPEKKIEALKALEELEKLSLTHHSSGTGESILR